MKAPQVGKPKRMTMELTLGLFILSACLPAVSWAGPSTESTDTAPVSPPAIGIREEQKGALYVGAETCATCHEDLVKKQKLSTHYGTISGTGRNVEGESCEACHGPGSIHAEDGNTKFITRYSPETCFSCHADKRAQFDLQFHHPVPEGRMTCLDCHDVHGLSVTHANTALERSNEKCFKCHKEFKGPYIFEHDPMREGCQVCHDPHGGVYEKLLVADQRTLCLRCHWEQASNTSAGNIGGVAHGNKGGTGGEYDIGEGEECIDHHRAVHGSNMWRTFNR